MTATSWTVELDADPDMTGQFVIDQSLLGGSDLVAPDERWIPVPWERVRTISIRRGGSAANRAYDAGECTVELDNSSGDFDPDNPYSFYTMGQVRLISQGTGLRVKANATTDAVVFTGYIEEPAIGGHWAAPIATFTCTDLLADLGKADVPPQGGQTGTGETSSARANWLLDQAGVPATLRNVAAAGRTLLGTTGRGKVREALDRVASGEAGRFFVDRTGVATLTWHDAEYNKVSTVDYNNVDGVGPMYTSIGSTPGVVGIINTATVHRVPPQVRDEETGEFRDGPELPDVGAQDPESIGLYGPRSTTVDVVLETDGDVESLAMFLATRRSQPTPRLARLVSVPLEVMTAAQAQAVLELDLGDLITVTQHTIDGRQVTWVANIENIAFDRSSPITRVEFATSPSDTAPVYGGTGWFLLGSSLLGGTAVLAPY